ncbi:MAG: EAL domain-containing protein [Lachnospiraceae bacterium]|nr:EAL domain-containing protein [Lachnospiraceae bacterium]
MKGYLDVMNQQLYFDNYITGADIVVLAVCIVIGVLLATSYVTRTKTFVLFINMIVYLFLAAVSDLILHDYYVHITDGNYTPIYVIRVFYHAFLFSLFLLFAVYLVAILKLPKSKKVPIMTVSTVIYVIVLVTDIVTSITGTGFRLNSDGTVYSGINIFMIGYVAFTALLTFVLLKYRTRVYRKALMGMFGTMIVAVLMLYNQGRHEQSSFTVAAFLLPVIAVFYFFHATPFNIETGTISASSISDAVSYYYSKKREFYYISLFLPNFQFENKPLPEDLRGAIREFPSKHFKKSVMFYATNGHMILMMPAKPNLDFDNKIQTVIGAFMAEYEKYHYDFKLIIGKSMEEISRKNEYLSFINIIQKRMEYNTVHMVSDEDMTAFNRSEEILRQLDDIYKKHDLNDDRVLVYCQPVLNIKTGKYDTAEALMRLKLPGLGMVFPDQFIYLAEDHGYVHILTKIILNKVCRTINEMLAEGIEVKRISINVSMPELRDEGFTRDIESIIEENKVPNGKVAIEVTESQSESDFMIIKSMIEELKDAGIKFYLDDFGTGYSNMERIMNLPFDIIKFDRSLVIACQDDKRSEEIVGRLAGMFNDLHYAVLYEGIEDENDETRCINMSASYLQGYKYSRPIPIKELRNFFSKAA